MSEFARPIDSPRFLAVVFAFYAMAATVFLGFWMPPFQNPDELAHFLRADQIGRGGLVGTPSQGTTGGFVDQAVIAAAGPFRDLPFHEDVKVTADMYARANVIGWSGMTEFASYPGVALYPPVGYLPAIAGIWLGKSSGLSIVHTLYLARLLTGITTTLIGAIAILLAARSALWLFCVLLLPMTLSQMNAVTQDGMIFAMAALSVGMLAPSVGSASVISTRRVWGFVAAISVVAMGRPPYAAMAGLLGLATGASRTTKASAMLAVWVLVLGWGVFAVLQAGTPSARPDAYIDPAAQLGWVMAHPLAFVKIMISTIATNATGYAASFIGRLGWLDVPLSRSYLAAAFVCLLCGAAATVNPRLDARGIVVFGTTLSILLVAFLALFLLLYMTWNGVAATMIEGPSGRYFIPLAFAFILAFPQVERIGPLRKTLMLVVVAFPAVTLAELVRAVVARYYV